MNNPWKRIFVILFICQEISAAQSSSNNSTKYDLTNVLNDAILRLFKGSDFFEKLEPEVLINDGKFEYYGYKIDNTEKLQPFGDTIDLNTMYTRRVCFSDLMMTNPPNTSTIRWDFRENRFRMFYAELYYRITGQVQVEESSSPYRYKDDDDGSASKFELDYNKYQNFSITATKLLVNPSFNENIIINISYDHLGNPKGIKLDKHRKLSYEQHLKLIYIIGLELSSMMDNFFNNCDDFNALLGEIFNLNPQQRIISAYPDFLTNEQRYYYLVPDINFMYMSFKNITIRGLSNFESYTNLKSYKYECILSDHIFVYTLHVKDVRGNMTLEPGFEHLPHFRLNFFIRNLNILWFVSKNKRFRVEAHNYSIVEDTPQAPSLISSWLSKYSASIIQFLQSAMADLMMPTKKSNSIPSSPQLAEMEASFGEILKNCTI
ncbi:uncharacterized protein LOC135837101 isoform X1 [Planococcus citri]|uniref:uncharacterized protein LOC135837101 isoform X1 n=1 Tax=Planococcus citri TaxID=170843 RepID=UPI0031FA2AC1